MQQLHIDNYVPGERWQNYRRDTDKMKKVEKRIPEMRTCEVTAVSPYVYDTNKMIAHILYPQTNKEIFVEKTHSPCHTVDLIHDATKELLERFASVPRLVMLSQLRYLALGELALQLKYYYRGVQVPLVPAYNGCEFDVRVYGLRLEY